MAEGNLVIVRYYDHILFKDALSSSTLKPVVRETVGWLEYENTEYMCIIWERYAEPIVGQGSRLRTTGLAIRKADIINLRKVKLS